MNEIRQGWLGIGALRGAVSPTKRWLGPLARASAAALLVLVSATDSTAVDRPNILWLTSEDNGPELGCYGDRYADTPNIDALAARGVMYTCCWSNAPVCAPARTAIISGLHPWSLGAEHMRSLVSLPAGFRMAPQYLRDAGYYCTNNAKEDYNVEKPGQVWDESSGKAHWENRAPDQPFFAVFNSQTSHESRVRARPHIPRHDPLDAPLPSYHPDSPEVRRDWAQYYDVVTKMDSEIGARLREVEEAGLMDDTIVFYFGDHGPGMPRSKRVPCDSGLRVPLIVYVPEKHRRHAGEEHLAGPRDDLPVAFVDLAPTLLSLADVAPPPHFQGRAFLGPHANRERGYVFGGRGRMDERWDLTRSTCDGRYVYLRNYLPYKPHGQHVDFMFKMPTTQVWHRLFLTGGLTPHQEAFWLPKAREELYDLHDDPDEVRNLARDPEHAKTLHRMRKALRDHLMAVRDVGFLPEAEMLGRSEGTSPYEMGHDPDAYRFEQVLEVAELASSPESGDLPELARSLAESPECAVRYWAAIGLLMRGSDAVSTAVPELEARLSDETPSVQIAAAHCLAAYGPEGLRERSLGVLVSRADYQQSGVHTAMLALNSLDELDDAALPVADRIASLPTDYQDPHYRLGDYLLWLVNHTLEGLH